MNGQDRKDIKPGLKVAIVLKQDQRSGKLTRGTIKDILTKPIRILLQTTIPATDDDWNIDRFRLLREHLSALTDEKGQPLCEVTARNRETNAAGDDRVLSRLETT